jgi:hypothetical protein
MFVVVTDCGSYNKLGFLGKLVLNGGALKGKWE